LEHDLMNLPQLLWTPFRWLGCFLKACWSVPRALLRSGMFWFCLFLALVVLLVVYYALANRYTPFTNDAYVQGYVVQVAPRVEGQVVEVAVREDQLVEQGDLLFVLDPRPFEHKVRQLEANLSLMTQQVAQMDSELQAARAEEARITADESLARAVHEQELQIFKKGSTTERKYLEALQKQQAAQALVDKARAVVRQKEQALQARIGNEHALVAEARAQLSTARLNLEWTRVLAPSGGYVTDLQLRVGSYVPAGRPVLTCIESSKWIVANFRESCLEHIRPGQRCGVVFKTYPGRVFPGTVQTLGWGVERGQGVPSGELPNVKTPEQLLSTAQRFQVRVLLDHPEEIALRVGATGSVTVFTTEDWVLNPIADFFERVEAWFFYLR